MMTIDSDEEVRVIWHSPQIDQLFLRLNRYYDTIQHSESDVESEPEKEFNFEGEEPTEEEADVFGDGMPTFVGTHIKQKRQRVEDVKKEKKKEKKSQHKKKPKQKTTEEEMNTSFSFEGVGDGPVQQPWDFSSVRRDLIPQDRSASVDAKIDRILQTRLPIGRPEEEEEEEEEEEQEDDEGEEEEGQEGEEKQTGYDYEAYYAPKEEVADINREFFSRVDDADDDDEVTMRWDQMDLNHHLLKAIKTLGYVKPTPIQAKGIPVAMLGQDLVGSAVTGSGKTAAFVLPMLDKIIKMKKGKAASIKGLILLPTRELAVQCHAVIEKLAQFCEVTAAIIVGGLSMTAQETVLKTRPDIIVATPGRLIDHIRNTRSVSLDSLSFLVLDEADRLLQMGFQAEIDEIISLCPIKRHTQLYSATMTEEVDQLIRLSLNEPVRVAVSVKLTVADRLSQEFIKVKGKMEKDRDAILLGEIDTEDVGLKTLSALCTKTIKSHTVIFVTQKVIAHRLKIIFGLSGLKASELHGNLTQNQRLEALEDFRDGKTDFLLATDLAARGLDILGIKTVINYEMPSSLVNYVHRVGRTARAGADGRSISLAGEKDKALLKRIVKRAKDKVKQRILPPQDVQFWRDRIADMEVEIKTVLSEEREEKEMRHAERDASRAVNMLKHEEEIMARPKKTWFLSEREKKQQQEADSTAKGFGKKRRQESGEEPPQKRKKIAGLLAPKEGQKLTRQQRRRKQFAADDAFVPKKKLLAKAKNYKDNIKRSKEDKAKAQRERSSNFEKEISTSKFSRGGGGEKKKSNGHRQKGGKRRK
ncbi:hypothetical protein PROFUN_00365 [Planoprotostelium fungivorum]|uniref:DEAD/DEAH box RNA helicase n=1 Tax=Planoprotostelium fungivorum TaxID=1890364 RepID=A0A2P6NY60_9EUKA|nr:hypothetical protein PROFUN_00365 [Planoprotostelium fungivorum]